MSESVHSLSEVKVELESNSNVKELSSTEGRNDKDSKSFQKDFMEGENICMREDFISPKSVRCEDLHYLSMDEVKQEDNFSEDGLSISEFRNAVEDSKSFQEQLIEEGKVWEREDFILPEGCKSGAVHSLTVPDVKLEDDSSVENSSINECRNDDGDSKSFQDQLIEGEKIWKREDLIPNESCLLCDEKHLSENTCPGCDLDSGHECNSDNIHLKGKNLLRNFKTRQKSGFGPYIGEELVIAQKKVLRIHKKPHTELKNQELTQESHLTASSSSDLKSHINSVHLKLKNYNCHLCEYTTTQRQNLEFHIKGVHLKLKDHKCRMCNYATITKSSLEAHISVVHLKVKNHKCHMCEFATTENFKLQLHIEAVHLKLKNNKCQQCEYTTSYKNALKLHMKRVHLKLKNHKCQQCQYAAYRKCDLETHINSVHLKLKSHKCQQCQYATSYKSGLENHINKVHLKLKNHKCQQCQYTASYKSNLQTHINTVHLKLRKHKCQQCEYTTSRKTILKSHVINVHLKQKNNKC